MKMDMPSLANYLPIRDYKPAYGDFIVWAGWFSTWFGVATNYNDKSGKLDVIFGGLPVLLVTMGEAEYKKNTQTIDLVKIQTSSPGTWAVLRHDARRNAIIWYV
jgi:hypothetical protein